MRALLVIAGCLAAGSVMAAVFKVGDTVADSCDFATLQDAIDAAEANGPEADTIVVANSGSYAGAALHIGDQSLVIEGGYGSCSGGQADAKADIVGNAADPVIQIAPQGSAKQQVTLRGLHIHGGGTPGISGTAGALIARELIVDGNSATHGGGGIVASEQAHLSMERDYPDSPAWHARPGTSARGSATTRSVSGASGTVGGAIAVYSHAQAEIAQTIVRGNTAQDGSVAWVDAATLKLESVLATGNQSFDTPTHSGSAIRTQFLITDIPATLRVAYATFSGNLDRKTTGDNAPGLDIVAQQNSQLSIYSTAFFDGPSSVTTYGGYTDVCVVETFGSTGYYGTHTRLLLTGMPGFNDADAGDFRLRSESTLNDYCDASMFVATHRDLVLQPSCEDDPRKPDTYGKCDVGAYESDHIFGNGLQ
jgi:hypothetical protein